MILCFSCQKELKFSDLKIGFREECPYCRADVHVCKNCLFWDPKVYNECKETAADVVREKDRANYCEFFKLKCSSGVDSQKVDLRAQAEALFKKKS
jgi:hypothetical protein